MKGKFASLLALLAFEAVESTADGTFLNEEQLDTINQGLADRDAKIQELNTSADLAQKEVNTLKEQNQSLSNQVVQQAEEISALKTKLSEAVQAANPGIITGTAGANGDDPEEKFTWSKQKFGK